MSSPKPIGLTPKQFGATNAVVTLAAMSFFVSHGDTHFTGQGVIRW